MLFSLFPLYSSSNSSQGSSHSPFTIHLSRGFTVVELAVVLVVLGAILVGVLKLEQVYRNYKIRQVVNQYRELTVAVKVYRDRYGYWPGDDPKANVHVGVAADHVGTADERIESTDAPNWKEEFYLAFEHLSRAGLIGGSYNGLSNYIKSPFNNAVFFITNNINSISTKRTHIRFSEVSSDVAQAIDTTLDDGNPATGMVQGYTAGMVGANYILTPMASYNAASTVTYLGIVVE